MLSTRSWFQIGNFFLTFSIIITLVADNLSFPDEFFKGDDPLIVKERQCWSGSAFQQFNGTGGFFHEHDVLHEFNWALIVVYLSLVALQIILALGNRPKGEKFTYSFSLYAFAFLAAYLIGNTVRVGNHSHYHKGQTALTSPSLPQILLTINAFCPLHVIIQQAQTSKGTSVVGVLLGSYVFGCG